MNAKNFVSKLLPLALCAALVTPTALATNETGVLISEPPAEGVLDQASNPVSVQVWGTVTKLEGGGIQVKNDSTVGINDIVLHISEDTLVLGATDGMPVALEDIKDGDMIYAYASPAMTRSLPPQSSALMILTNIPADFKVPAYYQVTDVMSISTLMSENNIINTTVETDQGVTLHFTLTDKVDEEGNRQYIQTDEVVFTPYLTKNVVGPQDLVPGSKILVWSDYEGNPTKVMVFPYGYTGHVKVFETGELRVNDQIISATALKGQDEILRLPVRAVAEAAGLTVAWDNATRSLSVQNQDVTLFTYALGGEAVKVEDDQMILVSPSVNVEGSVYMSVTDLTQLLDLYLVQ